MGKKKQSHSTHSSNLRNQSLAIYGRPWPKAARIDNKKRLANKNACDSIGEDDLEEEED